MRWLHSVTASYVPDDVLPLEDVKQDLDITHNDDDALIEAHRDSAMNWVEDYIGRFLGPVSLLYVADRIGANGLFLPFAPVSAVSSVSVGGSVVAGYISVPGASSLLLPPSTGPWPFYTAGMGAIRVTYDAGYPLGQCPPLLLQAAKLMVGIFYDRSREPEKDTEAVRNLIRSYRYAVAS